MFVMTAKLSKTKLLAAVFLVFAAVLLLILLAGSGAEPSQSAAGDTNDARVAYLAAFGWSVDTTPCQTQQVKIPENTENKVFARYNELQRSQGFDLAPYAGREVTRYVYEILNAADATGPVYATILVCDGQIIGGDITDSGEMGVITGFSRPAAVPETTQPLSSEESTTAEETTE